MNLFFDNGGASLSDLTLAAGGTLIVSESRNVRGITIDSRKVSRDDLFVALRGERFDGHAYIANALEAGAAAALTEKLPENVKGNFILVNDTLDALGKIASAYKDSVNPLTVGVTGSVGKTTAKQFIYAVLSRRFLTAKTEGNLNNQIGLPLSLLSLTRYHTAAVFEMGMSAFGEIERLSKLAKPDIAVITCIGTSHIEFLGSREGIRDAKLEIRAGLKPGGSLILNGDEPLLAGIPGARYVSLSNPCSDYQAQNIRYEEDGTHFDLKTPSGTESDLRILPRGEHIVLDAALAFAVGERAGISREEIRAGLLDFETTGMRQRFAKRNGITFIHDYYNAAPESMKASLKVLTDTASKAGGRSIAVLGDMRELGSFAPSLHESVGETAASLGVSRLYTFGTLARSIADGARSAGMDPDRIVSFEEIENPEPLIEALKAELRPGDTIVFKASRAVAMERVAEMLDKES